MNVEKFLANFGHIANAPDGVRSLRQLIMASALAGKFSFPNDSLPNDIGIRIESARSSYFERLKRREKPLLLSAPLIQVFDIPNGWHWARVGQICDLQTGATPSRQKPEYFGGDIRWLVSGDINLGEIFECDGRITEEGLAHSNCKILPVGTVLIALNGQGKTRATVALLRVPAACNQSLVGMIPFDTSIITPEYLYLALRYRYYEIRDITGQDQRRGLNMGLVSDLSVPLAPLAEQERIVSKVDELMALCDRLAVQQQERERTFPIFSRAAHVLLADAPSLENLNRVFDQAGAVSADDLRRTIRSLAVRGKLLPQDADDEPVEASLLRNDSHRQELARKDRRADHENQSLLSTEFCWDIAHTWKWRGLADLVLFVDYRGKTPNKISDGIRLLTAKNVREGEINLSPEEFLSEADYKKWMTRGFPKPGDVLFTTEAPMGNAAVVELSERFALAQRVICFQCYGAIEPAFLVLQILSDGFQLILDKHGTGVTAKGIKASKLKRLPVAVPPLAEQRRIVAKVNELMVMVDHLEAQQQERNKLAEAFATACIASLTGSINLEKTEKMKAPKTELVSLVTLDKKPKAGADAPLAAFLLKQNGELSAKALWQRSGLEIDAFYHQLKREIAQGWISPQPAEVRVLEEA